MTSKSSTISIERHRVKQETIQAHLRHRAPWCVRETTIIGRFRYCPVVITWFCFSKCRYLAGQQLRSVLCFDAFFIRMLLHFLCYSFQIHCTSIPHCDSKAKKNPMTQCKIELSPLGTRWRDPQAKDSTIFRWDKLLMLQMNKKRLSCMLHA